MGAGSPACRCAAEDPCHSGDRADKGVVERTRQYGVPAEISFHPRPDQDEVDATIGVISNQHTFADFTLEASHGRLVGVRETDSPQGFPAPPPPTRPPSIDAPDPPSSMSDSVALEGASSARDSAAAAADDGAARPGGAAAQQAALQPASDTQAVDAATAEMPLPRGAGARTQKQSPSSSSQPLRRSAFGESVAVYLNSKANASAAVGLIHALDNKLPHRASEERPSSGRAKCVSFADQASAPTFGKPPSGSSSARLASDLQPPRGVDSFGSSYSARLPQSARPPLGSARRFTGDSTRTSSSHHVTQAGVLWALQEVDMAASDPLTVRFFVAMLEPQERAQLEQSFSKDILHVRVTRGMLRSLFQAELFAKAADEARPDDLKAYNQEPGDALTVFDVKQLVLLAKASCGEAQSLASDSTGGTGGTSDGASATVAGSDLGRDAAAGVGHGSESDQLAARDCITKAELSAALLPTSNVGDPWMRDRSPGRQRPATFNFLRDGVVRRHSFLQLLEDGARSKKSVPAVAVPAAPPVGSQSARSPNDQAWRFDNRGLAASQGGRPVPQFPPPIPNTGLYIEARDRRRSWPVSLKPNPLTRGTVSPPVINGMPHGIRV